MGIPSSSLGVIFFSFILIFIAGFIIFSLYRMKNFESELKRKREERQNNRDKGIIGRLEESEIVEWVGNFIPAGKLEKIFNRAKNPWNMSIPVFQFIRWGVSGICLIIGLPMFLFAPWQLPVSICMIGVLCWYYPMYYYKAVGDEREAEWNKMYEFVWVIKHNIMLYGPQKAYMNVKNYIQEHAPHNLEIIQGFDDFYRLWHDDEIDPYIEQYYPFSVPREIVQILFNMHKTGDFPEQQLNSLRQFIINAQDLTVEKILSMVSSKATTFSLPFLMITVIIALMVPLLVQIIDMM